MSYVRMIDETEATGDALDVLQGYRSRLGYLPDMYAAMANSPKKIGPVASFLKSLQHGSTSIGGKREELIAVVVSVRHRCRY